MLMGTTSCAWRPVSDCTSSSFTYDLVKVLNQVLQSSVFFFSLQECIVLFKRREGLKRSSLSCVNWLQETSVVQQTVKQILKTPQISF